MSQIQLRYVIERSIWLAGFVVSLAFMAMSEPNLAGYAWFALMIGCLGGPVWRATRENAQQ